MDARRCLSNCERNSLCVICEQVGNRVGYIMKCEQPQSGTFVIVRVVIEPCSRSLSSKSNLGTGTENVGQDMAQTNVSERVRHSQNFGALHLKVFPKFSRTIVHGQKVRYTQFLDYPTSCSTGLRPQAATSLAVNCVVLPIIYHPMRQVCAWRAPPGRPWVMW